MFCLLGATATAQDYTRQGNNFAKARKAPTTAAAPSVNMFAQSGGNKPAGATQKAKKTPYTFTTPDGRKYDILLSVNGRAYIWRVSKKGNTYKQYLGEEVSRTICREINVEYKNLQR